MVDNYSPIPSIVNRHIYLFQAQIDSYLGREPVSVESVVVESIKSDVLQVSTPPPLVTPSHFHITPQNKVELSALSNIDLNVFVNLYTSVFVNM